jgi:hypothetical protein
MTTLRREKLLNCAKAPLHKIISLHFYVLLNPRLMRTHFIIKNELGREAEAVKEKS